jgi:heptosyltransferase-3
MAAVLNTNFPDARISMMLRNYTKEIPTGNKEVSEILTYDEPSGRLKPFVRMLTELRTKQFDLAVVAFPRPRIALLLFLAGIRARVGSGYRWYSFLFNRRVYEHRRGGEKHESEYNLSLLKAAGCRVPVKVYPVMHLGQEEKKVAHRIREAAGVRPDDDVAVLHPGSGGSAKDWRGANFALLAGELTKRGFRVVVTGSLGDVSLAGQVVRGSRRKIASLAGKLSLRELTALIQSSRVFVSNSTGPLHIAAAVGTPVIGFYPPVHVQGPQRWGPMTERKVVFVPDRQQCPLCKGGECRSDVCMDQIGVDDVVTAIMKLTGMETKGSRSLKNGGRRTKGLRTSTKTHLRK